MKIFTLLAGLCLLPACFGVSTSHPLCKDASLADVTGFPGAIKSSETIGDLRADVLRLNRGIYLIKDQNPPRNRPDDYPQAALRFCRIGQRIFSEYQLYYPVTKKLSSQTFWPSEVELAGRQLRFFLVDTDRARLDREEIPYFVLKQRGDTRTGQGFIVNNQSSETDKKLTGIFTRLDRLPHMVIDLQERFILSPVILY